MLFRLPILIRSYSAGMAVAQTAGLIDVSAAADEAPGAVERLELELVDRLERVHPSRLDALGLPESVDHERVSVPLYRDRIADERSEGRLETPVDAILETYGDGLRRLWVPVLETADWLVDGDDPDIRAELEAIATRLRRHDDTGPLHRPVPLEVELDEIAVDIEPLSAADTREADVAIDATSVPVLPHRETSPTPTLDRVAANWSGEEVGPVVGRRSLLDDIRKLVGGSRPEPIVLVGPPRGGKTSLVRHLAWESATGDNEDLGACDIWFADAARLTSPSTAADDWREQCRRIVDELAATDDILFIGRLAQSLSAGQSADSSQNLAQFLKPVVEDRRIRLIAEATPSEWNDVERRAPGLARDLQTIRVDAPAHPEDRRIFTQAVRRLGDRRDIDITDEALDRIWRLHDRFAATGTPFGRAIDFADRLLRRARQAFVDTVDGPEAVGQFCRETGLPEPLLRTDQTLDLADVRDRLSERVMGQPAAVERVADVIGVTKADLGAPNRPLGVFFFVGPTGVGKTELGKALADFMFGGDDQLIRLDMSEYASPGAFGRLTGESGGDGDLTGPVRRHPFSVVLLDEIEKAHRSVFDLLLQVVGEARLTDAQGRTTPFQNTVLIMTSNLAADEAPTDIAYDDDRSVDDWESAFRRAAEAHFRPEFLGRVDQFVPFRPLPVEVVADIATRELAALDDRIGVRQLGLAFDIDPAVADRAAELGWDDRYGARPLQRVVEQRIVWPVADRLARVKADDLRPTRVLLGVDDNGDFDVTVEATEHAADEFGATASLPSKTGKQQLARHVETVADLRRRTTRYLDSKLFAELERRVRDYDRASRSDTFWDTSDAAELAQQAEHAREMVDESHELLDDLLAAEDLAREAYHTRSIELAEDVATQIDAYADGVDDLFLTLLALPFDQPDEIALFLPSDHPEDEWRNEMVDHYREIARRRDWRLQLWQSIPGGARNRSIPIGADFSRGDLWQTQGSPQGRVVAANFRGRSVRAFLTWETGRHRAVLEGEDGSETAYVYTLPPNTDWPHPDAFRDESVPADVEADERLVRTWNYVEEILKPEGFEPIPFDDEQFWERVNRQLDRRAWEIVSWM